MRPRHPRRCGTRPYAKAAQPQEDRKKIADEIHDVMYDRLPGIRGGSFAQAGAAYRPPICAVII